MDNKNGNGIFYLTYEDLIELNFSTKIYCNQC